MVNALIEVEELYELREPEPIERFIREYDGIAQVLLEATEVIARYFPDGTRLALSLDDDPNDDEAPPTLFAIAITDLPRAEARQRLYRFREGWWRRAAKPFSPRLAFAVE